MGVWANAQRNFYKLIASRMSGNRWKFQKESDTIRKFVIGDKMVNEAIEKGGTLENKIVINTALRNTLHFITGCFYLNYFN